MERYIIDNAVIWTGNGTKLDGHLVVNADTIEAIHEGRANGDLPKIDLSGMAVSPGMIDLMVLGGFNKSILSNDPYDIARDYLRLGVTACQFCTGTLPYESYLKIGANIRTAKARNGRDAAEVLGFYPEGPFQHPERTGASLPKYALPPTRENIDRFLSDIGDTITMLNISPGTEGDAEAVGMLKRAGKTVSMAHSDAPADCVQACVAAGTSVLGHVWDNNSGRIGDSGVQQPTIEHVALTDDRVRFIHLICDGTHVHPVMIQLVLRARGLEAVCMVTDAVPRAGCNDGPFTWDDGRTFIKSKGVSRTTEGMLAGSGLLLPDMFRNFVKFTGIPAHEAIRTVTLNPAMSLGFEDRLGLLAPGRRASFIAWDEKLRVRRVWHLGREVESVSDFAEVAL